MQLGFWEAGLRQSWVFNKLQVLLLLPRFWEAGLESDSGVSTAGIQVDSAQFVNSALLLSQPWMLALVQMPWSSFCSWDFCFVPHLAQHCRSPALPPVGCKWLEGGGGCWVTYEWIFLVFVLHCCLELLCSLKDCVPHPCLQLMPWTPHIRNFNPGAMF